MRDRYKKNKYYPEIAEIIGRNFKKLHALCFRENIGYFDSRNYEDIFQDTVIYVIQDTMSLTCKTDSDLIQHFLYRYRMIEYQAIQDAKQIKTIPYADYLQTPKEPAEE